MKNSTLTCTDNWVHVNFTIQDVLNYDRNCTVNYDAPFNAFRLAFWTEEYFIDQSLDNVSITNVNNSLPGPTGNQIPEFIENTVNGVLSSDFTHIYTTIHLGTAINSSNVAFDEEGDDIYFAHTCDFASNMLGDQNLFSEVIESSFETTDEFLANANTVNVSECGTEFIYRGPIEHEAWNFTLKDKPGQSCTTPFEYYWNITNSSGTNNQSATVNYYLGYIPPAFLNNDTLRMEGWDKDFNHLLYSIFVAYDYPNNYYRYYIVDSDGDFVQLYFASVSTLYTPLITVNLDFTNQRYQVLIDVNEDNSYDFQSIWYDFIEDGLRLQHLYFAALPDMPIDYFSQVFGAHTGQFMLNGFNVFMTTLPEFTGTYPNDRYTFICSYPLIGEYVLKVYTTDDAHPGDLSSNIEWHVIVLPVSYAPDESTFTNVSILYPDEFNESIFNPPDIASCGAVCQFAWMMGFPSRISHMLDAETGSTTFQIISDAVAFSTIIAALMFLLITMDFNKTIIYTWAYVMIHMFIGYMPLYIFVFMTFMMAIVLAAWKRSMETGLGGRVTGGGPGSDDYVPK